MSLFPSGCLQNFFFVSRFQKFKYEILRCIIFYSAWYSLIFLYLWIIPVVCFLPLILENSQPLPFCSLPFRLGHFYWHILKFTDSFLGYLSLGVNPLKAFFISATTLFSFHFTLTVFIFLLKFPFDLAFCPIFPL